MASPDELVRLIGHLYEIQRFLQVDERRSKRQEGISLFDSEMRTLLTISGQEGQTQAKLCHRMMRSKSVTSGVVDRLEEKGLVYRAKTDTRCRLYLTEQGRYICQEKRALDFRRANDVVEEIPVELEDLRTANEVLEQLVCYCQKKYKEEAARKE